MNPEFESFVKLFGPLFELPSGRSRVLRRALGRAIDDQMAFGKGMVQRKKTLFIRRALELADVQWSSSEPHKLISNLKNRGDGHQTATLALLFLSCKVEELHEVRVACARALDTGHTQAAGIPQPQYHLQAILSEAAPPTANGSAQDSEGKRFAQLVDPMVMPSVDHRPKKTDATAAKDVGRDFLETELSTFFQSRRHRTGASALAIIDVDDMTKINKVYGYELGDFVLATLENLIKDVTRSLDCRVGRCGDDTFFIALRGLGMAKALKVLEKLRLMIQDHPWGRDAEGLHVSVSIGTAREKLGESSVALAIRAATGMKAAKERGGNNLMPGPTFIAHNYLVERGSTRRHWS